MPKAAKDLTESDQAKLKALRALLRDGESDPEQFNLLLFEPYPDRPEKYSQQTSFFGRNGKVQIAMGGNRSGKSYVAAMKCAKLLLWDQPPPWKDTPFVIVSNTYEQTCDICWKQNLSKIIPPSQITHPSWHNKADNRPSHVYLKEWPNRPGKNWVIEFHAVAKGRQKLQGQKIGGCWFSEQFPWEVFDEILRGCGHTWFDGAQFAEFTPIEADLCVAVENKRNAAAKGDLPGWKFYRLNTDDNKHNLNENWYKTWLMQLDPSVRETRMTGAIPLFRGAIYPHFSPDIHVLDDAGWLRVTGKRFPGTERDPKTGLRRDGRGKDLNLPETGRYLLSDHFEMKAAFPLNVAHRRGVDWGFSEDHPFCTVWGFKDGTGRWFIYDELFDPSCSRTSDRIAEIKNRWPWENNLATIYGPTYADPSRIDLIDEFNCGGIPCDGADNSVDTGIETMRNLMAVQRFGDKLETKLYIYGPNCPKLIEHLRQYRWVEGVNTGKNPHVARPVPLKHFDDLCDALRYMCHSDRSHMIDEIPPGMTVSGDGSRHGVWSAR